MNRNDLNQFANGTGNHYQGMFGILHTDAIQYMSLNGASWLVTDMMVILKVEKKVNSQEFVTINCVVKDKKAVVTYEDGNDNVLFTQKYGYTDLGEGEYKFFFTNNVLMFSREY
jgi:hypothetical protein